MKFLRPIAVFAALLTLSACGAGMADVNMDDGEDLADNQDALVSKARFETFTGKDGQHYFHLLAGNGEKVLASEGYPTVAGAEVGIASVKANGIVEGRYLLRETSDGASYFVVTAANGAIIGMSEMYVSQANATRAITTVMAIVKVVVAQAPATLGARFEVFKGLDAQYYFHIRAGNGEIVMQSQGYASKAGANSGVTSVKTNGTNSARYTVLAAADGKYYFVLKATNGQVIGRGQTYVSRSGAAQGVATCVELLTPNTVK